MSVIKGSKFRVLWDLPTDSPDVVSTVLYFGQTAAEIDYSSPSVEVAVPKVEFNWPVDAPTFTPPSQANKTFVKLATKDSTGNLSDLVPAAGLSIPFDITPPSPPLNIRLA